jgi:hypothetical protein
MCIESSVPVLQQFSTPATTVATYSFTVTGIDTANAKLTTSATVTVNVQ